MENQSAQSQYIIDQINQEATKVVGYIINLRHSREWTLVYAKPWRTNQ